MKATGCTLSLTVSIDFEVLAELLDITTEEVYELWDYGNLEDVLQNNIGVLGVLHETDLYEYGGLRVGSSH